MAFSSELWERLGPSFAHFRELASFGSLMGAQPYSGAEKRGRRTKPDQDRWRNGLLLHRLAADTPPTGLQPSFLMTCGIGGVFCPQYRAGAVKPGFLRVRTPVVLPVVFLRRSLSLHHPFPVDA